MIAARSQHDAPARPVLHLSGARLRATLAALIRSAEAVGGIERFAAAVRLKAELIGERLAEGRAVSLERASFIEIARFMPTVRRRIGALIETQGWPHVRAAIAELLSDAQVPGTGDARIAAFERALASPALRAEGAARTGSPRFLRDLAAEILHNTFPEHYPLMTRWVWDARANTGVLREIWHDPAAGDATDRIIIDAPDTHETFLVLREELSGFLTAEGIFRDVIWYVDLLCAQIYGDYVSSQGGAWLKADFVAEGDPLEHTRRMLGLDEHAARGRTATAMIHTPPGGAGSDPALS